MAKQREIDWQSIFSMDENQQQQIYATLSKRANQRMRDLKKSEHNSGAVKKAEKELDKLGRKTFKQSNKLTGFELKENLKILRDFYTAKTSSAEGIKKLEEENLERFRERHKLVINDKKKFWQFISSQQFKALSKNADSNQVLEDFTNALNQGFTLEQIEEGYREFLNEDMTFEQVAERRNAGKVLK